MDVPSREGHPRRTMINLQTALTVTKQWGLFANCVTPSPYLGSLFRQGYRLSRTMQGTSIKGYRRPILSPNANQVKLTGMSGFWLQLICRSQACRRPVNPLSRHSKFGAPTEAVQNNCRDQTRIPTELEINRASVSQPICGGTADPILSVRLMLCCHVDRGII